MRLEVGAGGSPTPGYEHMDVRAGDHIEYVCPSWETPLENGAVEDIYARHFFEHLSPPEAGKTLFEWKRILARPATIHLVVPNLVFHLQQLLMEGNSPFFTDKVVSNQEHALFSIYGWPGENMQHKWGYTQGRLCSLLSSHGFRPEVCQSRECDIAVEAAI